MINDIILDLTLLKNKDTGEEGKATLSKRNRLAQ